MRWVLAILLLVSSLASPATAVPANAAATQFRAFWVDAFGPGIYDQSQVDQLVRDVKTANMNAIVAQVVRRGDCFCNRSMLPRTQEAIAALPFDPLQALIDTAHAQGIEVHAWIITTGIWKGTTPPLSPDHAFNRHGPSAPGADNWIDYRSDGLNVIGDDYFIDPGHPDAAAYIVKMATSIAMNYAVDGINLDRIRYPDSNLGSLVPSWGYNPVSIARFQAATGRTDRPAPTDQQWAQWRRDQVSGIVRRIYLETYAIRRGIRISADTITYGSGPQATAGGWEQTRPYAEQLQDWRGWMREGILDLNIPMNYKRDGDPNQRQWYAQWSDFAKDEQNRRQSTVGSALYLNDLPASIRQARNAVATSTAGSSSAGWVGYSYRTPDALTDAGSRTAASARAELITALTQPSSDDPVGPPLFVAPAAVPEMFWKTQPVTGHLIGVVTDANGAPIGQVPVTLTDAAGAAVATRLTDGTGWFGFVDLPAGAYHATVTSGRASGGSGQATVVAGQLSTVSPAVAACTSTVGPGIPPPVRVPSGVPGFHTQWYGQSGYPTLCAGDQSTAVVAYINTGSRGWVQGRLGEVAYLGTWDPVPGQDRPSTIGGDGQLGSPNTAWPRYNRVALQPAAYVGPNQVAWFQFTIQAPTTPGTYRLYIRPLVEGAQWMEDYGVFWYVTVR